MTKNWLVERDIGAGRMVWVLNIMEKEVGKGIRDVGIEEKASGTVSLQAVEGLRTKNMLVEWDACGTRGKGEGRE